LNKNEDKNCEIPPKLLPKNRTGANLNFSPTILFPNIL